MMAVEGTRALTMLNKRGDTTITWEEENDEKMAAIIEKKMAAGVAFFIITPRTPGQRGRVAKPKPLKKIEDAMKHRALSIPDKDFSKFVMDGLGTAVPTPAEPAQTVRRAKTAREVATSHSVSVGQRQRG